MERFPRMRGYAVIDVETTGLRPSWNDRVVEIGVVHVTTNGDISGEWTTLVNPQRDLGPQHIHGITAADIRHALTFAAVSGTLLALLKDRVPVAHNLRFDCDFLQVGVRAVGRLPPVRRRGSAPSREAAHHLPAAPRTLAGCCGTGRDPPRRSPRGPRGRPRRRRSAAPLPEVRRRALGRRPHPDLARSSLDRGPTGQARRGGGAEPSTSWAADRPAPPRGREGGGADLSGPPRPGAAGPPHLRLRGRLLVDLATRLDLSRGDLDRLHNDYLSALAGAALADGVVTPDERHELDLVADLLRLPRARVDLLLLAGAAVPAEARERFRLRPGDLVVFTGEMDEGRDYWEGRAREAAIVPHGNITKKVRLLVAADPDSLSGKAVKPAPTGSRS